MDDTMGNGVGRTKMLASIIVHSSAYLPWVMMLCVEIENTQAVEYSVSCRECYAAMSVVTMCAI
jgi:hypothetical protein